VASRPFISGICTSMSTTSNLRPVADVATSSAERPLSTAEIRWPRFCNSRVTSLRFTWLSSATRMRSGRTRARTARVDDGGRRVETPNAVTSASSKSECLTGLLR
jgi:hypothetical protein